MSEELIKVANNVREMFAADDELSADIRRVCDIAIAALSQQTEPIGEVKESGVVWANQNPHAYPIGTKFYTAPQSGLREVNTDTVSVPRVLYQQIKLIAEEHARDVDDAGGDGCVICKHIFGAAQEGKK